MTKYEMRPVQYLYMSEGVGPNVQANSRGGFCYGISFALLNAYCVRYYEILGISPILFKIALVNPDWP